MNNWHKYNLSDLIYCNLGKMLDKQKNKGKYEPYLANINVRWGSFDLTNLQQMRFEESENEKYGLNYGDLIICEGGEPGRCAIWENQLPNMKIQKALHRVRPKKGVDNRFLYYWFLWASQNGKLKPYFTGSTIKHLPVEGLLDINIRIPAIDIQKVSANILYTLDQKIQLNNAINVELEKVAKTLYNYWFVQFDFPNAKGKPYRTSGGKMEYNEVLKMEIPKGWKVKQLKEICRIKSGYPFSSKFYLKNGKFRLITIKNVQEDGVNLNVDSFLDTIPENMPDYCLLHPGDILMSLTGNVGRVGLMFENDCLLNQRVAVTQPVSETVKGYCYFLLKSDYIRAIVDNMASGSSQDNLSPIDTENIFLPFDSKVISDYNAKITPIVQHIVSLKMQNKELTELRDFLLPLLMNGQVIVKSGKKTYNGGVKQGAKTNE